MPYSNISANLSNSDRDAILQDLADIVALLPMLVNLTPSERQGGAKLGDKSLAFVLKALEYAEANPNLVPPYMDVPEFRKDENLREKLVIIFRKVTQLAESLDDTILALGREEYQQALTFYNSVQQAAKNNVPGSDSIATDLGERFEQAPRDNKSDATPPEEGNGGSEEGTETAEEE